MELLFGWLVRLAMCVCELENKHAHVVEVPAQRLGATCERVARDERITVSREAEDATLGGLAPPLDAQGAVVGEGGAVPTEILHAQPQLAARLAGDARWERGGHQSVYTRKGNGGTLLSSR